MRCVICKHGETTAGHVTVTLERGGSTLVFKEVPAEVCTNCGEHYVGGEAAQSLLAAAEAAVSAGVQLEVRQYAAA